ncbi:E3 ubiquitin ligase PARAQUAT TOLERANCE 3-like isoform X1 [Cucumis melo]|uniref:E3 ubiquitin ligase PARAQUAT TOLERANCE 3-like isoform X1 n=2 Tax=Cucumis melo TaxID=3656 RepID=A0ABM3KXB5_CUCME|nr:E3 ubiquitin ligase PARAQUAT TOLERANCE 3-like isoform X1 [Cucumis melo]
MAVYYKFKSARDYDSIAMDGPFISVGTLKEKIFESKHLGRGTDFDLVVTNAQTNEEYLDEAMLIPKNTSVLIRRVPGRPRLPIVTKQEPKVESEVEDMELDKSTVPAADSSAALRFPDDSEWDEFGNDLYAIPDVLPVQPSNPILDAPPTNRAEEDSKIKALIDTPALDWQHQGSDGFGPGRGFGRGAGGRMGGRGFGFERKTPPQGYVCHRCKIPGHFIQHCPTNGDPSYDIRRVKPPTGIPKSMLMATPDGSYALPSGAVAVLKPNEAAFEKEIEGLPSTRSVGDLPPELHCPLCKEVMKDAVLTSKCCFKSFCDKCIRDHIINKSACVCGATNILADDLLPNKTLRDTINRILESGNSSADNAGSAYQVQVDNLCLDMESARVAQPKVPSPTLSAASKGERNVQSVIEETTKTKEVEEEKVVTSGPQTLVEKVKATKVVDESEATHESISVKEQASQGSALIVDEEVQQKMAASEAVKKKKKKKVRPPANDFQWKTSQDLATENYMMPMGGPAPYNPYWTGMQSGFDGYMNMPSYAAPMPYMGGYGLGPLDMPFGPVMPQDPFAMQNYMFPVAPPQRDLADFGMGMNIAPPAMSREEFEARKAGLNMRRKHENERRVESREREPPKDREFGREVCTSGDGPSMKQKSKFAPQTSTSEHNPNRRRPESSPDGARNVGPPCPPLPRKRKSEHHDHDIDKDNHNDHYDHGHNRHRQPSESRGASEVSAKSAASAAADRKQKMSVFSRISFPEEESIKKRKLSSSKEAPPNDSGASATHHKSSSSNGYYDDYKPKAATTMVTSSRGRSSATSATSLDCESSDDDRHFKRKPSRYEPSPPPPSDWDQEESRHPRGSTRDRERERERERSSYSKHR